MPWVRFDRDFDWRPYWPSGRVIVAYKAGMVENVTTRCMEEAIASGAGQRTVNPRRRGQADAAGS